MKYKLFDGDIPHVSTLAFHANRPRAAHLEQPLHRPRLDRAAAFVTIAAQLGAATCSDLGCGDGGLLSLLAGVDGLDAWGYDFAPANAAGWAERGVKAELADVFGADRDRVRLGECSVLTEVLEHIADPDGVIGWVGERSRFVVASSPWTEGPWGADECHAWAFDMTGYRDLITAGGFRLLRHEPVGQFQVVLGMKP